ncbi:hypothetical protein G6F37_003214 [Rhizopus arrhizus]|nr:hypothetical protein G6F38_003372 [Rhizopus arrhizus]KAG1161284.1 hypothetical protein G6F37_003214 [Rhizopus arrhizus]
MLEDAFVYRYVDVLLDAIFGSESRFKDDWANGSLLRSRPQQNSNEDTSSNSSDDDEIDKNSQGHNNSSLLY